MTHNSFNIGIVIAIIAVIAGWDLYSIATDNLTISRTLLNWSAEWPIVSFSFGVLFGHLFWPQRPK